MFEGEYSSLTSDLRSVLLLYGDTEEVSEIEDGFGQVRLKDSPVKEPRQEHEEES